LVFDGRTYNTVKALQIRINIYPGFFDVNK